MQISTGQGGWHEVEGDELGLPGRIYFRVQDVDGVLRVTELYLDGQGQPIPAGALRAFPLQRVEQVAGVDEHGKPDTYVRSTLRTAGPDLSRLAAHYAASFGESADHWVADAWRAQIQGSGVKQAPMPKKKSASREELPLELEPPPGGRLTDAFLSDVARAYAAAIQRGLSPAKTLAPMVNVQAKTIHSWVALARARGLMPPATRTGRIV